MNKTNGAHGLAGCILTTAIFLALPSAAPGQTNNTQIADELRAFRPPDDPLILMANVSNRPDFDSPASWGSPE